jgi:hypothetical protein
MTTRTLKVETNLSTGGGLASSGTATRDNRT